MYQRHILGEPQNKYQRHILSEPQNFCFGSHEDCFGSHEDLWTAIFCRLPLHDLLSLRTVCKEWNRIIGSKYFQDCYYAFLARDQWWLAITGLNVVYHIPTRSWWNLGEDVYEIGLGKWRVNRNRISTEKHNMLVESEGDPFYPFMHLTWLKDENVFCCVDARDEVSESYDDDSMDPNFRLGIYDIESLQHRYIKVNDDFDKDSEFFGCMQATYDEQGWRLIFMTTYHHQSEYGNAIVVHSYNSLGQQEEDISTARCDYTDASLYSSNFHVQGWFYLLLVYANGIGISGLRYHLTCDKWHHWGTGLNADFFSSANIEPNLLKCHNKILSVGGFEGRLVVVYLCPPEDDEPGTFYLREDTDQEFYIVEDPCEEAPRLGSWNEMATMPLEMYEVMRGCAAEQKFKVFANDFYIFLLPERVRIGQKGILYNLWFRRWEWMASFPQIRIRKDGLHWSDLLGNYSLTIHHF